MSVPSFETLETVKCTNSSKIYDVRKHGNCTITIRKEDADVNNLCFDGFIQGNNSSFSISKMTQKQFTCFKESVQSLLNYYEAQNLFLAE